MYVDILSLVYTKRKSKTSDALSPSHCSTIVMFVVSTGDHSVPSLGVFCATFMSISVCRELVLINIFNPSPPDKDLDWSNLKQIADDILKCIKMKNKCHTE